MSVVLDPLSATFPAIEARLRTFFKADRWDFHVVDDPMSEEEFKAIVRRTPLLALGWRQFNPSSKSVGRRFQGGFGLRLTIVVKHPNGPRARFMGDDRGPGLLPSICGAALLINGFTLEGVGTFSVTACAQAYAQGFSGMNTALATMDIGIDVAIGDVTGDLAAAPDFLKLVSKFEPWPDGQAPDAPIDVRPAP